jgi:Dyp-type peroxidase family
MQRASRVVASAAQPESPHADTWVSVGLSFAGLEALGLPQASLESFPPEFRAGMAARAGILRDTGSSAPERWEAPFGSKDAHVVVTGITPERSQLEEVVKRAEETFRGLPGVSVLWRQNCYAPADEREHFGYRDGISHPAVEGSGSPPSNPLEKPIKAGEFVLGYEDEIGVMPACPDPPELGRNGAYMAVRKLHQDVAAFRRFLREHAENPMEEEKLAAKLMGRWRGGAPLALNPEKEDQVLGADSQRRNQFLFFDDDKLGYKTPPGSHIRRMNPRDGLKESGTFVRIRRMIRRGTVYGTHLPEGAMDDDGQDRGLIFLFIGASLARQFEFVQANWANDGEFLGGGENQLDPVTGSGSGEFVIPHRPIRRTLRGLPRFVTTRGGEYFFLPSLPALRWLGNLL